MPGDDKFIDNFGPLDGPRGRSEDNIKIDVRKIGSEVWSGFIWLRMGSR
jgi:hypothetical protein